MTNFLLDSETSLSFPVTLVILPLSLEAGVALFAEEPAEVLAVVLEVSAGLVSLAAVVFSVAVFTAVVTFVVAELFVFVVFFAVSEAFFAVSEEEPALAAAFTTVGAEPFKAQLLSKEYFLPSIVLVPVAAAPLAVR